MQLNSKLITLTLTVTQHDYRDFLYHRLLSPDHFASEKQLRNVFAKY